MVICPNCGKNTPEGKFCEHCGSLLTSRQAPILSSDQPVTPQHPSEKKRSAGQTVLMAIGGVFLVFIIIIIIAAFVFGMGGNTINGGSTCSPGYSVFSTSDGHCCLTGYPYYYDGQCHQCSQGYYKYNMSAGYCCPEGYPYYYDGQCHQCSQGYSEYATSAGYCCPVGYPFYYEGKCHQCSQGYNTYSTSAGQCCPVGYPYYYNGQCWNRQ